MPLFSSEIAGKSEGARRRLYSLFTRAVKAGEVPALKLLDRFPLTGSKGQSREVQDFAYTTSTAEQVKAWITQHEQQSTSKGVTVQDVQALTDEQLTALIKAQRKPTKRRRKRASSATGNGGEDGARNE